MDPETRGGCRFCVPLDMENKDNFDKLQEAHGEGCVSWAWVSKWAKAFRELRTSLADDRRSGRPRIPYEVERIMSRSNASHINLAQPWHETLVYPKHRYERL
jgi:hypothetical protein